MSCASAGCTTGTGCGAKQCGCAGGGGWSSAWRRSTRRIISCCANGCAARESIPRSEVEIVTVPPPQMYLNLRAGNVDGYCVGEPWNSLAVLRRTGWCVATSAELAPRHPEKVLMVRADFAEDRAEEHLALIAALLEACAFCDRPENRERIMETLAQPAYLDAPIHALRMSLSGTFNFGHGRVEKDRDFQIFSREDANRADGGERRVGPGPVVRVRAGRRSRGASARPHRADASAPIFFSKPNNLSHHEDALAPIPPHFPRPLCQGGRAGHSLCRSAEGMGRLGAGQRRAGDAGDEVRHHRADRLLIDRHCPREGALQKVRDQLDGEQRGELGGDSRLAFQRGYCRRPTCFSACRSPSTMGLMGAPKKPMVIPWLLNRNGQSITLANKFKGQGRGRSKGAEAIRGGGEESRRAAEFRDDLSARHARHVDPLLFRGGRNQSGYRCCAHHRAAAADGR